MQKPFEEIPPREPLVAPDAESPASGSTGALGKIIALGFVLGLLGLMGWGLVRVQAGPVSQGRAPDFQITGFDGKVLTLSELKGQVVVINFWASWCPPCREEAAYLEQTWRKYKDAGVVFIGVDYLDTEAEALAYIEEFEITYFNGPDIGTKISQSYNIQGVPETFFVNRNGILREPHIGPLSPPTLDNIIDELLAEPFNDD